MKKTTKTFIITFAVLVLLFGGLLAYTKISKEIQVKEYNNFKFTKSNILWIVEVQKGNQPYTIPFYHFPTELEDIPAEPNIENILLHAATYNQQNTTVFITLDPTWKSKAVVAATEISRLTGDRYDILNLRTKSALTSQPIEQNANAQNPIVTCDAVGNNTIVIWLRKSAVNLIHEEEGCIILEAPDEDEILKVADKFAYMILGIMED